MGLDPPIPHTAALPRGSGHFRSMRWIRSRRHDRAAARYGARSPAGHTDQRMISAELSDDRVEARSIRDDLDQAFSNLRIAAGGIQGRSKADLEGAGVPRAVIPFGSGHLSHPQCSVPVYFQAMIRRAERASAARRSIGQPVRGRARWPSRARESARYLRSGPRGSSSCDPGRRTHAALHGCCKRL